jgi:hypothetical protein
MTLRFHPHVISDWVLADFTQVKLESALREAQVVLALTYRYAASFVCPVVQDNERQHAWSCLRTQD